MKKLLLFLTFLLLLTGCSFSFQKNKTYSKNSLDQNTNSTSTPILDSFFNDFSRTDKYFDDTIKASTNGNLEFKTFYSNGENDDDWYKNPVIEMGDQVIKVLSQGDVMLGEGNPMSKVEIYTGSKLVDSKKTDIANVISVFQVKYDKNKYYNLIENWIGGGVHCCYLINTVYSDSNRINIGNDFDLGQFDIISKDNFFVKDNNLYFYFYDTSFAYYKSSFVGSQAIFMPLIYKVDVNGNYSLAVNEFEKLYSDMADLSADSINNLQKQNIDSIKNELPRLLWSESPLIDLKNEIILPRIIFWLQAGLIANRDNEKTWEQFDSYYNYFIGDNKLDETKKEIKDIYNNRTISQGNSHR